MLRFKTLSGLFGALLGALLLASPANGSIVQALELDELVAQSDRILVGRVLFSESFQHPNGLLGTWHRIAVERSLNGEPVSEPEVIVETLGGQVGDIAMRVEGEPSFSEGERVVLFARQDGPLQVLRAVGMGQGVMRVLTEEGVDMVRQSRAGMMLMRRGPKGQLERSAGALPKKERLDDFLGRVRTLVDQRKAGGTND
jgi:hypothetical protein